MVGLIPARKGSQRVRGKNMRLLNGIPLIAYSIASAIESDVFTSVQVWTDDVQVHQWVAETQSVKSYPRDVSGPDEPDIDWVRLALEHQPPDVAAFAILRPTSPFRTAAMIQRAKRQFSPEMSSLRAVTPWLGPHPGKMWAASWPAGILVPVMDHQWTPGARAPAHSSPTQSLCPIYRQTSSLEMAWATNVTAKVPTIAGAKIAGFLVDGPEAFAIDTETDWADAVAMAAMHPDWLPRIPTHVR